MFHKFFQSWSGGKTTAPIQGRLADAEISSTNTELEQKVNALISNVISAATHRHQGADISEDANDSYQQLENLRTFLHRYMGISGTNSDLFADLKNLTNERHLRQFINELLVQNILPQDNGSVKEIISKLEAGEIDTIMAATRKAVQQSLYGHLQAMEEADSLLAKQYVGDRIGQQFSRVDPVTRERQLDVEKLNHVQTMLNREFGGRGAGITGGDSGLIMLRNILNAKKSIDIGMFQMEHSGMLSALHSMQQMGVKINMVLNPANEGSDVKKVGFSWMNQAAKNLLGDSVMFDPDVQEGRARYAHQKFIAVDLDSDDYRDASVMIGSFNMTRGALGQLFDRAGNLVLQNPHNIELGLNINYDLVRSHGLKEETFRKVVSEAKDYRDWMLRRNQNPKMNPLGYNPEHILTGRQTYDRIQKALGVGGHPTSNPSKVNAFFMLNVITDRGMQAIDKNPDGTPRGLYHDIKETLDANKESRVTIFVTKGFRGIRSADLGKENAETSKALEKIRELEREFGDRFKLQEVDQHIHAKTAMIFRNGHLDVISGSTNVSSTAMGGWSQEVSMALSTRDFTEGQWLLGQANNILNYMWASSARVSKRNPIADVSHAHHENIRMELQRRLNPMTERLVSIKPIKGLDGNTVGSFVSLSARMTDPKTGRMVEIKDAVTFRVFQYLDDPNRIYLPDLEKIIDPVLAQAKHAVVEKGRGGTRGQLTSIEIGASGVLAAAAEHIVNQMNRSGSALMKEYGSEMYSGRRNAIFKKHMIKMAGEIFRDTLKNFEGLPVGEYATDARKFKRLVYGLEMRKLTGNVDEVTKQLAKMYTGNPFATEAPVLTMDSNLMPSLDPMSIEASFNNITFWELAFDSVGHEIKPNAPDSVLRMVEGEIRKMPLNFTVLAQSLGHDAPANLFLAEGFKYLTATDFDEETQGVQFLLNGAKLDQLAQRFQNMLGADISRVFTVAGSAAEKSLKTVVSHVGASGDYDEKTGVTKERRGTRLNMLLVFGVGEQALMQADVFRGSSVGRKMRMKFQFKQSDLINSADFTGFELFGGQVRLDENGEFVVRNENGEYVKPEEGKPILEIGSDQKHIKGLTIQGKRGRKVLVESNPLYGIQDATIRINNIKFAEGKNEIIVEAQRIMPMSSSTRLLSQGIKMVATFMGSINENGKRRSIFTDLVEGINKAVAAHADESVDYQISGNGTSVSFGTVGSFYKKTFRALGMSSADAQRTLDVGKVHGLVGENIVKSGVALLHTGYALLSGEFDQGAWANEFVSIFEDQTKYREFKTMLHRLQEQTDLGKKAYSGANTDLQKLFLLEGIDALLAGEGVLQKKLVESLSNLEKDRKQFLNTIERIRTGELNIVTAMSDKVVLSAAAAYHVIQSIEHGKLLRKDMIDTSMRIGGKSVDPFSSSNIMWDTFIPLTLVENFSVATAMSTRESSLFHTNFVSEHSQVILRTLSFNPEVLNRSRMVSEIMAIGYLGGTAVNVASTSVQRLNVGGSSRDISVNTRSQSNVMIAGVHFEALAYIGPGMGENAGKALQAISLLTKKLTMGKQTVRGNDVVNVPLSEKELQEVKAEFEQHLQTIQNDMSAGTTVNNDNSPLKNEEYMRMFKLMSEARVGAPIIRLPKLSFEKKNEYTYEVHFMGYEDLSLPSPDAVTTLQTFDNHMGEILKLSAEVLKSNLIMRRFTQSLYLAGDKTRVNAEMRFEYEAWYAKVQTLKAKIQEAATTDIQKAMTSLSGVRGFAAIANTFGGFDGLKMTDDQRKKEIAIDNVVLVGDEMMMTFMDDAMSALKLARQSMRAAGVAKVERFVQSVAASNQGTATLNQVDTATKNQLKLSGKMIVVKGQVRSGGIQSLKLSNYLLNAEDTFDGDVSKNSRIRGVGGILSTIQTHYSQKRESKNILQIAERIEKQETELNNLSEHLNRLTAMADSRITLFIDSSTLKGLQNEIKSTRDQMKSLSRKTEKTLRDLHAAFASQDMWTENKSTPELLALAKQKHLENTALNEIFALRIQKEFLQNTITHADQNMNPIAKEKIKEALGIVDEKLQILGSGIEHREKIQQRVLQLKEQHDKAVTESDKKQIQKHLVFVESQLNRIDSGINYSTRELMSSATYRDISHAFDAAGINLIKLLGDTRASAGNLTTLEHVDMFLQKTSNTFSAQALVNLLRDSQQIRDMGMAIAAQRAGLPVGPTGPTGFIVRSVREGNQTFRDLGSSYNIDVQMSRRSIFMHFTGMALNLGDFDGDNTIVATLKRYTMLKAVQHASGDEGLAALERYYTDEVKRMQSDNINQKDQAYIAAQEMLSPLKDGSMTERIGYAAEIAQIEKNIYRDQGDMIVRMTEQYMGMSEGTITEIAKTMFGTHWTKAVDSGNQNEVQALRMRAAVGMNQFAADMYSSIYNETTAALQGKELDEISDDELEQALKDSKLKDAMSSWYQKASKGMVGKSLAHIFGSEINIDMLLKYGVKVAFASTKLIGNWTNMQTLQQSMNTASRMATYYQISELEKMATEALDEHGDPKAFIETQEYLRTLRSAELKKADIISGRLSGYMQQLQQATRDAIKEKALSATRKNQDRSGFEQMLIDNVFVKAIDSTYTLLSGKSIFDNKQMGEMFNRQSDIYKALVNMNIDEGINISLKTLDNGNQDVVATFTEEFIDQHYDTVKDILLPHLEAAAKISGKWADYQAKMGEGQAARERMKYLLSADGLNQEAVTNAILMVRSLANNLEYHETYQAYKRAAFKEEASHFNVAREQMSDHMKVVFLYEQFKGGKLNQTALDNVMTDIIETFVLPTMDTTELERQARSVDPSGNFANNLATMVQGYVKGQRVNDIFSQIQTNEKHLELLAEFEEKLAKLTEQNPLAAVELPPEEGGPEGDIPDRDVLAQRVRESARMQQEAHKMNRELKRDIKHVSQHGLIVGVLGGILASGSMLFGAKSAEASPMVSSTYVGTREDDPDSFKKVLDFSVNMALTWETNILFKSIQNAEISKEQKALGIGTLTTAIVASEFVSNAAVKAFGAKAAAVASLVTMTGVGHLGEKFTEEIFRQRHGQYAEFRGIQMSDDISLQTRIENELSQISESLGVSGGDERAIIMTEEGPIPGVENVDDAAVGEGITTNNGNPIVPYAEDSFNAYSKPESLSKGNRVSEVARASKDGKPSELDYRPDADGLTPAARDVYNRVKSYGHY